MSVRAYKLIEIKTEKTPQFNCGEMDIVNQGRWSELDNILIFDKERVKNIIENPTERIEFLKENVETFKRILEDMGDEDYVEYYCY